MLTIIIRVIIIYVLVLFVFRLMGKRQLGQMQPFELVLTLILADLATIPMAEMSVPILHGIVPLLTLVVFHFFLTTLTRASTAFSKFISGKPIIIVGPDGIVHSALKQLNITLDDLLEAIREAGYFSFSEVQYAIMETNGKVSVMPKPEFSPLTQGDMDKVQKADSIPLTIISEGKYMKENLEMSDHGQEFFDKILKKQNIKNTKSVLILTLTQNGEIYLQEKNKKAKTLKI